jgi:hypothetical protein
LPSVVPYIPLIKDNFSIVLASTTDMLPKSPNCNRTHSFPEIQLSWQYHHCLLINKSEKENNTLKVAVNKSYQYSSHTDSSLVHRLIKYCTSRIIGKTPQGERRPPLKSLNNLFISLHLPNYPSNLAKNLPKISPIVSLR